MLSTIFLLIIFQGYKLHKPSKATQSDTEQTATGAAIELRFAYSLLEKLIQYIDRATINMKLLKPSTTFSRRSSFKTSTRDIKFFSKVSLVFSQVLCQKYCYFYQLTIKDLVHFLGFRRSKL